ncbi:integrase and RNaseH domain-containing protein [Blumeria hordei DH14]|uniref:Integrase and RNaseH domain-containing protein n=1 Tax=Blumeria graminis f. sp. hordei (strain DH14) TaxID=546991 RepID=N1J8K7_BLUG1|nr:integrase and RNaseH domain-containing protein [Blumeria hordei DH14]
MAESVVKEKWGKNFNPKDPADLTEKVVNGYILHTKLWYEKGDCKDYELWAAFREDFEGWTSEIFNMWDTKIRRDFRNFLVQHGVYIPRDVGKVSDALFKVVSDENFHEWTEQEVKEYMKNAKDFFSRFNPSRQTTLAVPTLQGPPLEQIPLSSSNNIGIKSEPFPPTKTFGLQDSSTSPYTFQNKGPKLPLFPQAKIPTQHENTQFASQLNLMPTPLSVVATKLLTNSMKVYQDDTKKYSGELYNILNTKLQIFYDCCQKVGLGVDQYQNAYSIMLKGRASFFYYDRLAGHGYDFMNMIDMTKAQFETEENKQLYMSEWRETTLPTIISQYPSATQLDCLQKIFDKLQIVQRGLTETYQTEYSLHDQVINAYRGVEECNLALYNPANIYEGVCAQLRSAVGTAARSRNSQHFVSNNNNPENDAAQSDQNWTDRTYGGRGRGYPHSGNSRGSHDHRNRLISSSRQKRCFICKKPNCWSNKHTDEERREAFKKFRQQLRDNLMSYFQTFLVNFEGIEGLSEEIVLDETEQLLMEVEINDLQNRSFFAEFGEIDGAKTVAILKDQSVFHAITKADIFKQSNVDSTFRLTNDSAFTFNDQYTSVTFQGIMPDSDVAGVSTVGASQCATLQRLNPLVQVDTSIAGKHRIRFGKGEALSQDMHRMRVKLDNLENVLIQGEKVVPIIRKFVHPWMLLNHPEQSIAWSHLTEVELRQLHRRFGHPSSWQLFRLLQRAGNDVELAAIEMLTKYCHLCQMNGKSPGRFKFSLKKDYDFNFKIVVDVMWIINNPVLHVIDTATSFQAARFPKNMSAKTAWDTLRICWIDVYLGPPDYIMHDAGTNFASDEFRKSAKSMAINVKEVPIEAHNSIGKVERYHAPLYRAFEVILEELQDKTNLDLILQMAIKAINDTAGPDGIVPTLLVFGAYSRMTKDSPPSPSITKRAEAIRKATLEVRRLYAQRQVKDALSMKNGPNTNSLLNLPLQSDVRVWREKEKWTGPSKLISMNGENCTIQMPHGPATFRSTVVKPYYTEDHNDVSDNQGLRWPKRSRHKPSAYFMHKNTDNNGASDIEWELENTWAFISEKEKSDFKLSLELGRQGKIITPGQPFEASDKQEIDSLIEKGVFKFEKFDTNKHGSTRIFKSRIVREVKGKTSITPYEKSRLVIQGYNNRGKKIILTQSPTIQQASQRLIIALTPTLQKQQMELWLRDISQAYTQSTTKLNRVVLAELPIEIKHLYPLDTIMVIIKPLYGIAEAGTHWSATYNKHHREKLLMSTSTYDPCLLLTTSKDKFGIVGMQTDDTLILSDEKFAALEEDKLAEANFVAKPRKILTQTSSLDFNGCILSQIDKNVFLRQKEQSIKT